MEDLIMIALTVIPVLHQIQEVSLAAEIRYANLVLSPTTC